MKRIVLAASILAISGFAAVAQTAPVALPAAIEAQILSLVPEANLSGLTNVQYAQIVSLFANSSNLSSGANPAGAVEAILGAQ